MIWFHSDSLAESTLCGSEDTVARLVWAPRWRSSYGSGKLDAQHERTRRLCLIFSLGLQYLFVHHDVRKVCVSAVERARLGKAHVEKVEPRAVHVNQKFV